MTLLRERKCYAAAALGTAIFAAIYECFSHRVYSGFMIFAFLVPLLGGVLPCSIWMKAAKQRRPRAPSRCLDASAIVHDFVYFSLICRFQQMRHEIVVIGADRVSKHPPPEPRV